MKKIQPVIHAAYDPTPTNTITTGFPLGMSWYNTETGNKFYHKLNGVWKMSDDFSTDIETDKVSTTKISAIKTFYDWAVTKFQPVKQATELYVSQAEKNAWGDKQVLLTKNGLGNFPSSFKLPYACTVKGVTKSDNCTAYSITIAGTVYTTNAILNVNVPANTSIIINDLTATGGVIANALLILTQNAQ